MEFEEFEPGTMVSGCAFYAKDNELRPLKTGYLDVNLGSDSVFVLAPGSLVENVFIAPRERGFAWARVPLRGRFHRWLLKMLGVHVREKGTPMPDYSAPA